MKDLINQTQVSEHDPQFNSYSYVINEWSDGTFTAEFRGDTLGPFFSQEAAEVGVYLSLSKAL